MKYSKNYILKSSKKIKHIKNLNYVNFFIYDLCQFFYAQIKIRIFLIVFYCASSNSCN